MKQDYISEAPAKLNLHLAVGGVRADGYHAISSLFCRIGLSDIIRLHVEKASSFSVKVTGLEDLCEPGSDTLTRTAKFWSEATGAAYALSVDVEKHIPDRAGLGGGSSDAATLLKMLDQIEPLNCEELMAVALNVGSDLPFFITGSSWAWVTGRGERVEELEFKTGQPVCLALPKKKRVVTRKAYRKLDRKSRPFPPSRHKILGELSSGGISGLGEVRRNDFELLLPRRGVYEGLLQAQVGLKGVGGLTGSGSCWFFTSDSADEVDVFSTRLSESRTGAGVEILSTQIK